MNGIAYEGSAILVVGDFEIPVTADLSIEQSGGLKMWVGFLQADDPAASFWEAFDSDHTKLRMPNGKEGNVILRSAGDGSGCVEITGAGAAPF